MLENIKRPQLPWDSVCFPALPEPHPQCQSEGFSHHTLLLEMDTEPRQERSHGCAFLKESKPNISDGIS